MEEFLLRNGHIDNRIDFDKIRISIASPEVIYSWSYGEVRKPETINYRTLKPEREGLFCAKIFGPIQNYACLCGKYKRLKHRGVVCERCGVEVTLASVRRERMAHINLAAPVVHIWFLRSLPSRIGLLLDMSLRDLEKILYFESNVIIDGGMTKFETGTLVSDQEYREIFAEYGDEVLIDAGAAAIRKLLAQLDLATEIINLKSTIAATTSDMKLAKLNKRLKLFEAFKKSNNKPEWMVLTVLPVIAPDLRPLVPLEGGRFATSELNECYKKVINRNNRLKRLIDLKAPEIILRNEKRMLQEAVDALFDNGKSGRVVTGSNKRPLKSLADGIKGKHGRFRQNLLGKRVDYSGRSVITVGPNLKLYQCGLPKRMALELFRPFIYGALQRQGYASTIKAARRIFEEELDIVWDLLEKIIHQHPILLNRAPTLHRLSIQAFEPKLIEGKAIQLHPLVCAAFNADFDGDSMAVHIPLTLEAQIESRVLMFPTNNILLPANGDPIVIPTQDIVLGIYYISLEKAGAKGEGKLFTSMEAVKRAYDTNSVDIHAKIKVRLADNTMIDTVVGRTLLSSILPEGLPFELINRVLNKKTISEIIIYCYNQLGAKATVIFVDQLMYAGYKYCTKSGSSISVRDMVIPKEKSLLINEADSMVRKITSQFENGIITNEERYSKIIDIWTTVIDKLGKKMLEHISSDRQEHKKEFNPLYMMCDSGARGSMAQLRQIGGMRGLMIKPNGTIIETPITASLREGLTVLQYFNSTHGARKGLADTALRTATAGYLTRRLVDAAQDLIIKSEDCRTTKGIKMTALIKGGSVITTLEKRILGRVNVEEIKLQDNQIIPANTLLDEVILAKLIRNGIDQVIVRSPMTCEERRGICAKCYGSDLSRGKLVDIGEAVGIIAAQSIGEPGTQLTMRTFHSGGTSSAAAAEHQIITNNIGRIVFSNVKSIANRHGELVVVSRSGILSLFDEAGRECERHKIPFGAILKTDNNAKVSIGAIVAVWDPHVEPIIAEVSGYVAFSNMQEGFSFKEQVDSLTGLSSKRIIASSLYRADIESSPTIHIVDETTYQSNSPVSKKSYVLPVGSIVNLDVGNKVLAGDILAYIPIEISKAKDIIGGLPRIAEIFEARVPKDAAILAPMDGTISFGKETKDKRRIIIKSHHGKQAVEILVPKWRSINLLKGEVVKTGEVLVEGHLNPHDTLKFCGLEALAGTMVNELQEIYRLQGISINDKHIETIIRTVLRKVSIITCPDNTFSPGDQVDLVTVLEKNDELLKENKPLITYERILLGITKSALSTESFLSAASFQETTRILTEAAVNGEIDHLRGLKENVLIGRLIPAGTGMAYRRWKKEAHYVSAAEQGYIGLDELL